MTDTVDRKRPRRTWLAVLVPVALLAVAGTALVATPLGGWLSQLADSSEAESVEPEPQTAVVTITDLNEEFEVDATLAAATTASVTATGTGTITTLPAVGQTLAAGEVVYSVDEQPVVYLAGATPAWRSMTVDSVGPDVEQLEQALVAMGYDTAGELSVDETYTSYTAALVELWQDDLGLEPTGVVTHGSVVFAQPDDLGHVTVAEVGATVGDQVSAGQGTSPTSPTVVLSDGQRHAEFVVDYVEQLTLLDGTEVEVRLPDRSVIAATVVGRIDLGQGQWLISAVPHASGAASAASLNDIPVTVSWSTTLSAEALTVPANALLRHDSGLYMVTIADGGVERDVVVVPVAAVDRLVEITGDLNEGDLVVVP